MSSQQNSRSFLNSPSAQSTSTSTSTSKVLRPPKKAPASKREAKTKSSAEAPPPLPAPINADNLSKYFADIASRIDAAIVRHNSVTSDDRKEIIALAGALKDASVHVTNVMEASTMINNISSTDLIASIRDVVKEEVRQTASASSYASAVAQPPIAQRPNKPTISRPAIIIASKDPTQKHTEVLGAWRKSVTFRDAEYAPARVQHVSHNKIRVEFDNVQQRDEALNRTQKVKTLEVQEAKRRRPMLILKGVHKDVEKDEVLELVGRNNPSIKSAIKGEGDVRVCFLRRNRNENLYNVVIEVTPLVRVRMLEIGRINIDHQRVHVCDFSPFVQCHHCLQFGHTKNKCPENTPTACYHCASTEHIFEDCPKEVWEDDKKTRCFNCHQHNVKTNGSAKENHCALSEACPKVKAMKQRINERIQYEC